MRVAAEHLLEETAARLEAVLPPGRVRRDVPFAELTTYRLGGPAAVVARVAGLDELAGVAGALSGVPVVVVGRGSNLLVADEGFAGVALLLEGDLAGFEVGAGPGGDPVVRAGGGLALPRLARRAAAAGAGGLEFYVGIPGSVGGAVRMNAGGHGRDTAAVLRRAWLWDLGAGVVTERAPASLELGYRCSSVTPGQVVVAAELAAVAADPAACEARIDAVVAWRRTHQPGGQNAGSVFANPPGDAAGRLVDACGLKGFAVGGVRVSERHANFFQAGAGARAADVAALVDEVVRRVEAATGVRLRPELRRVGFAGQPGARPGAPPAWDAEEHAWPAPAREAAGGDPPGGEAPAGPGP